MSATPPFHPSLHSVRQPVIAPLIPAGVFDQRSNRAAGRIAPVEAPPTMGDTALTEAPRSTLPDALLPPKPRAYKARARLCKCGCGARFTPTPTHPRQRFASKACAQRDRRSKQPKRARRSNGVGKLYCGCCGLWYVGTAGKGRKYCGSICKRRAARERREATAYGLALALGLTLEQARDQVEVHGVKAASAALLTLTQPTPLAAVGAS